MRDGHYLSNFIKSQKHSKFKSYVLLACLGLITVFILFNLAMAKYVITEEKEISFQLNDINLKESEIIIEPDYWTNDSVTLKVEADKSGEIYYKINEDGKWTKYEGELNIDENCDVYFKLVYEDGEGPEIIKKVTNIVKPKEEVARVTTDRYSVIFDSVQQAIDAAGEEEAVVTLLKDNIEECVTVAENQNIVLDVNGKTLVGVNESTITNNGTLTISGESGTITCSGADTIKNAGSLVKDTETKIENTSTADYCVINNTGETTISAGTIYSDWRGICNYDDGKVTITGGTFEAKSNVIRNFGTADTETAPAVKISGDPILTSTVSNNIVNDASATGLIYINGGTINAINPNAANPTVLNSGDGKIIIEEGTIRSSGTNAVVYNGDNSGNSTGTVEIRGGIIESDTTVGVKNREKGNIIISGGTITSVKQAIRNEGTGTVTVTGGSITSSEATGIYNNSTGTIIVGDDDDSVSTEEPSITGKIAGVNAGSGTFNFYDGVIKGESGAGSAIKGEVAETPEGYAVVKTADGTVETAVLESTKPTIVVSPASATACKEKSVTITIKNVGGESELSSSNEYQYYLSSSSTELKDGTWKDYTSGTAFTIGSGITGTRYLFVKRVSDNAEQVSTKNGTATTISGVTYQRFGSYVFDNTKPTAWINTESMYVTDGLVTRLDGVNNNGGSHSSSVATWKDISSNGKNGTITDGTWGANYLDFNGTSSWVNLGEMNSDYQTVEATFSPYTVPKSNQYIIGNWETGGGGIAINGSGYIYGQYYIEGYKSIVSGVKVVANEKYHAALTYNGTAVILYINGVEQGRTPVSGTIGAPKNSTVMALGVNPTGNTPNNGGYFDGKIYNAAVYNKALTAAQVKTNADAGKALAGGPTNASSITYTIRFNEKVTGFTTDDITVSNGTKGTFTQVTEGSLYRVAVTTSANQNNTQTIALAADGCTDSAGNGIAATSKEVVIDRVAPTVTLSANGGTYNITPENTTVPVSTTLTASDTGSGIAGLSYAWGTSKTTEPSSWTAFTSGTAITKALSGGNNYLWTNVIDNAGNRATSIKTSDAFTVNYQVAFDSNNGTGAPNAQSKVHGTNLTLSSTKPTRTGYTFKEWNTKADGTGTKYASGASYTANSAVTLYAQWTANTNTPYVVNHYVHDLGATTYTLDSTDNLTGTSDATLTVANLKKTIAGFTYVDGYITGNGAKPSSGAVTTTTILPDGTRVINLYYRRNYLYVQYDMNGGSLGTSGTGHSYSGTLVTYNNNTKFLRGVYESKVGGVNTSTYVVDTSGLHNYNNSSSINILRTGYSAKSGAEWNTKADGTGTSYNHATATYSANGFAGADLSTGDKTVTIYVNWVANKYKVTLDNQGATTAGTAAYWYKYNTTTTVDGTTVYYYTDEAMSASPMKGSTITKPEKTGYTFGGYYTGTNGTGTQYVDATGKCINNIYKVAGNTTLYAKWTANTYKVTANANGGTIPATTGWTIASGSATATKNVTYDSTYGTLPTPTKTGYTFTGWNGKNLFNKDATPISTPTYIKGDGTLLTSNEYSLYQVSIKPNTTYTITNSGQSNAPGYVIYNASGTRVAGENYAMTKEITFTTPSTASYIKFSVVTQTSSNRYDKDTFQLEEGDKATAYEPYYVTSTTKVTTAGNHTLYAQWTPNNYTITFNYNGQHNYATPAATLTKSSFTGGSNQGLTVATGTFDGLKSGDTLHITYDMSYTNLTAATGQSASLYSQGTCNPSGDWVTMGSSAKQALSGSGTTKFDYTVSLTDAKVANNAFRVAIRFDYYVSGSVTVSNVKITRVTTETKTLAYATALGTLPTPTETGYTLNGWYTASSGGTKISSTTTVPAKDTTYYAQWTANTYTVKYNGNGNTGGSTANSSHTYDVAKALTANGFTRTGYTFAGWSTSSSTTTQINDATEYTATRTSSTSGNVNVKQYTVKGPFTAGDVYQLDVDIKGSGNLYNYFYGASGYKQIASLTTSKGNTITNKTDGQNIVALTSSYTHYTVRFTIGSGGTDSVDKYILFRLDSGDATATIKNVQLHKVTANDKVYVDKQSVTNLTATSSATVNLYATWTINQYNLTINPNGGTWNGKTASSTVTQNYNTTYSVINNPTRAGYVFNGWTLSGSGTYNYFDTSSTATETQIVNYNSASSTLPSVYNNSKNGTVTNSMAADSTATGGYSLKVVTNGTATPGAGGISLDIWPTTPGRINVLEVKAKIPTGYNLQLAGIENQYTGIGSKYKYDSNAGTGAWKTYYMVVFMGDTGTFGTKAYLNLNGSDNTSVTWNIDSIVMKSYTKEQFKSKYTFGAGNGTLTANWVASGSRVTFNTNSGTFNTTYVKNWSNGYNGASATSAYRYYNYNTAYATHPGDTNYNWTPDSRVISRTGYTFDGWYTATSGGTKIFNADGTLVKSVSSYSDASGKWIKYDANVTLYAHWTAKTYNITLNPNSGSYNGSTSNSTVTGTFNQDVNIGYPTRSGYTFTGWQTSDGTIYDRNLLNGVTAPTGISSSGTNAAGTWRSASGGTGTREAVAVSDPPVPGITKGFKLTRESGNVDISQDAIPVTVGAQYTISVWAKGTGTLALQAGNSTYKSKTFTLSNVTTWTKYSWTFTAGTDGSANNNQTNIYFGNRGGTSEIQICGMKLESSTGFADLLWSKIATGTTSVTLLAQWSANKATITINKDGAAWSASGMKIDLSTSNTSNTATFTSTVSSGSTAVFNNTVSGTTYYIYAGKHDGAKTTMVNTGVTVVGGLNKTATVNYYTITRSQETGTTLETRWDSSSGTTFTNNPVVLGNNKVTIYGKVTINSGYNGTATLKHGSTSMTASGSTFTVSAKETVASAGATANKVTININKDGSAWADSGMKVELYSGTTAKGYTATISSGSSAELSGAVPNGTYNVYIGKDSNHKTTLVDSGIDVTVNNNSPSATVNYYTLTVQTATSGTATVNGTSVANNGTVVLAGGTTTTANNYAHAIVGAGSSGYHFSSWTAVSGSPTIASTSTASTTVKVGAASTIKVTGAANTVTITVNKDGAAWNASGIKLELRQSDAVKYSVTANTSGKATGAMSAVANGTYDLFAGKHDGAKTTMVDTGTDIVVSNNNKTATVNYYTITRSQGTGTTLETRWDSSSGTTFTNNPVVLGNNKVTIYGKATINTGYNGTATLKHGSTSMTASGSTFTVSAKETVASAGATENTYTIAFNKNGGTGTMTSLTSVKYTASKTLTANTFTRTDYRFVGWNTKSDGSGTSYADGASVSKLTSTNNGTVTLYAQWKKNNYEGRNKSGTFLEYYTTLDEAFSSTNANLYEIKVLNNILETGNATVPSGKDFRLSGLNGTRQIDMRDYTITNNGKLEILNVNIMAAYADVAIKNTGNLIIGTGTVQTDNTAIHCTGSGSTSINGTNISGKTGIKFESTGGLTINGSGTTIQAIDGDAIWMSKGKLEYKNGTTNSASGFGVLLNGSVTSVTIKDGKIRGKTGIYISSGSPTVTIEGGEITGDRGVQSDGTATITVGKTTSTSTTSPIIAGEDSGLVLFAGTATMNCGVLRANINTIYGNVTPRTGYSFVHRASTDSWYSTETIVKANTTTTSSTSTASKAMALKNITDMALTAKLNNVAENNQENTDSIENKETIENIVKSENAGNTESVQNTESVVNAETSSTVSKVVQINETTYPTISEAIASANSGEQIELLEDISLNDEVIIEKDKNIIINLNSKTLTSTSANAINNKGTLKIVGTGSIINKVDNGVVINNDGKLEISSGKIISEGMSSTAIYNNYKSEAVIKAGTVEVKGNGSKGFYNNSSLAITPTNTVKIIVSSDDSIGIYNSKESTICNIKSTEILIKADVIENYESIKNTDEFKAKLKQMKPSYGIYHNSNISVNIEGLTMKVERLKGVGIQNNAEGTITIGKKDGILNESNPIVYATEDNTTAIVNVNTQKGKIKFYDGSFITTKSIKNEITDMLEDYEIFEIKNEATIKSILRRKED